MSYRGIENELTELGADIALREIWAVLEPIISEAEHGGEPIRLPQLACALRAAYGRGFIDALSWVEGKPALTPDRNEPPRR